MGKRVLQGSLATAGSLLGGLLIGFALGDVVFRLIPGSSIDNVNLGHVAIAAVPALGGCLGGGAAWGLFMGHLAGASGSRRMAVAGMLGFGPITIALALGLGLAEPLVVESVHGQIPIHRIFTLMFAPAAFLIAGISAWALGRGLRDGALARRLLWQVGLAAGLTFLAANLLMEASGWVVGAPRAAERATMLVVLFSGNLAAALVAGGLLGHVLVSRRSAAPQPERVPAQI
jgi:hypothetical protein